jgi:Tol biopolymer transport system component
MAAPAPTRLGPYEIVSRLGKGGMGEVWKARDPRLNRDVAVKVSAQQFTDRFEREARAIAALNHPNICTLYDVGPNYLVMELVEGPTLAEHIAQGPIPLEEALNIARQIADALEAAHDKAIVHRDLKPANIKIKPDGSVKVLDFGLAKSGEVPALTPDSPTMMSVPGMILGTAGYMSPEQARGKDVDKRADIWAFGVVLYEMLTAKRLFEGETISDTLAAVIKEEPDLTKVPAKVQRLLRRCLEKDPKKRLRDITGAEFLLEDAGPAENTHSKLLWVAAASFALAAAVALAIVHFREAPLEARVVNSALLPPEGVQFELGSTLMPALPALSPDGKRIVFGAKAKDGKPQLWLRRLDSATAQPLPGTEGAGLPFWSPDGRWVGFGQDNKLKKIDIQGGPPVVIADLTTTFGGGSWSPQGVIIFGGRSANDATPILRVAAAGGTPVPAVGIEQGKERGAHKFPWFLPDGRHFLYTSQRGGDIPVRVGSLGEPAKPGKVVAQAQSNAVYAQGHLLYLRESTLMAQPFDLDRLETTGEAVPIAEGVPTLTQPSRAAVFSVSTGGLLVVQSTTAGFEYRLVWKDRQGNALGNLGEATGVIRDIELSPDGKRVAAAVQDRSSVADIWIYDVARGIPTRFTFDSASDTDPAWSPDGGTLYFCRSQMDLFRKASNGAGAEELLLHDAFEKISRSVSPDGKLLLYIRVGGKTGRDLWVLPLTPSQTGGQPEPRPFLQTPFDEAFGQFSPDGQWVAYRSDESGRLEVYAAPFPGPGGKHQISYGGGGLARWRRDGKELFYVTPDGQLMAAEVATRNGTLEVGRVQKLFDGVVSTNDYTYDVSADGQKFLVVDDGAASSRPLTLLQNWTAMLKK